MAIQNRRGQYADFDPSKAVPGELLTVLSGDPNSKDGKAVYMTFASGDVKRMATYEDMVDNIEAATEEVAQDVADQIEENLQPMVQTAQTAAQTATTKANEASQSASSVSASAAQIATNTSDISDLKSVLSDINLIRGSVQYGNFWDYDATGYGYFSVGDGGKLIEGGTLYKYCYKYIPVNAGDLIMFNTTRPFIVAYDTKLNIVECVQPTWSGYTIPQGVAFIRLSIPSANESGFYCFVNGTSQNAYKSKSQYYIPSIRTELPPIIVEYMGTGDYTSLTRALYETDRDVVVMPGTYDIVAEYKELFGSNVFDTMTYLSEAINGIPTNGFQWGLYIDNRTVTFMSGASVVCDMSDYDNGASRRFSPFNLVRNAILDGCFCTAINPYYIVHDDFGGNTDPPFTNIIKNCVLITPEATNGNVIGGGCKKFSTKIVDNCYLDNGVNKPVTMRYHNTNVVGASPRVIIKDTRCNQRIRVNRYGTQTSTKMTAIINNCKASLIEVADETSGAADNVVLYKWNNEEN